MTKTQGRLIKILAALNILIFAGAAWLLWYVWPVLVESPIPVVPTSSFVVPVAAPTLTPETTEEEFAELDLATPPRVIPAISPSATLVLSRTSAVAAYMTPTPQDLIWPSKQLENNANSAAGEWGAPTPLPSVKLSPQQVNILVMGADYQKGKGHWRTDTIVVITIDPVRQTIRLLSIPRDLWVYIPGYGHERINTADFLGERTDVNNGRADLIRQTIELNFGIPIHYFARINYDAFEKIINTLGGVSVQVDCPLQETFQDSRSPTGWSHFSIEPGIHHMDGWTALVFARLRKTTSDFDRIRRQQAIMKGVWQGALAADVIRDGPRLYGVLKDSVETDLNLQNILALGYVAVRVSPSSIRSYYVDRSMVRSWTTPAGAAVLLPVPEHIAETVQDMFSEREAVEEIVEHEKARVKILDGIGNPDKADLLASQLRWKGLRVVRVEPAGTTDYAQSVIIDYGTFEKKQSLDCLCEVLGVAPESVEKVTDPTSTVDFLVILGNSYDPCNLR